MPTILNDPYSTDRTPKATVEIVHRDPNTRDFVWTEYANITEYSYDSDILQIGDPCSFALSNPDGQYSNAFRRLDKLNFYLSDPDVNGGTKTQKVTGLITSTRYGGDVNSGDTITIAGADIGWLLANCCAPLFRRYRNFTWTHLLKTVVDPTWGFKPTRFENATNRNIKLGRKIVQSITAGLLTVLPPVQFEPGQMVSDVLISLGQLDNKLINVSADGAIQVFAPDYTTPPLYTFHNHASTESSRNRNNVESYGLDDSADGVYTHVTCVGQVAYTGNSAYQGAPTADDPNEGKLRGEYFNTATADLVRYFSFSDGNRMRKKDAQNRALWKWQRGQFDSWTLTYTVKGHSQNGYFYEPDTMCEVNDTILGVSGKYYISAVRYQRSMQSGTQTILTIKKPNLLRA